NDPLDAEPIFTFEHQDGFAITQGYIVFAYQWSVSLRGLSIHSVDECQSIDWAGSFYGLLGAENFVPFYARGWLNEAKPAEKRKWHGLARRLFLTALYNCPGPPVSRECIESSLFDLWN